MALGTRLDEDGYRKPMLARRRRDEIRVSLISSRKVIHDALLLVYSEFLQSLCSFIRKAL